MSDIVIALFCLVMIANVIVLVRHWQMMRMMRFVLNSFVETQKQFNDIMEREQHKK